MSVSRILFTHRASLLLLAASLPFACLNAATAQPQPRPQTRLPLIFEANQGQFDHDVRFAANTKGRTFLFTTGARVIVRRHGAEQGRNAPLVRLVHANPAAAAVGTEELRAKANYFIGADRSKWRTDVRTFARIRYSRVYPGVDLVFYGNQNGELEYDFILPPGADPARIAADISPSLPGGSPLRLDARGDLVSQGPGAAIRFKHPIVYEEDREGQRRFVRGSYVLHAGAPGAAPGVTRVSFEIGSHDRSKRLVIDPAIAYSTLLGGVTQDAGNDAYGVATYTDPSSGRTYAYVVGATCAANFPTINALRPTFSGGSTQYFPGACDAFVTKFDPSASGAASVVFSTYLGGNQSDGATGVAVDANGNAYITGSTGSTDFPVTASAYQTAVKFGALCGACTSGADDMFLAKLSANGSALMYSTYFGGSSSDDGSAIALDAAGRAFIAGRTNSTDLPTMNPLQASFRTVAVSTNGFVAGFDTSKSGAASLIYSSYLGGASALFGIAVDPAGMLHVGGCYAPPYTNNAADFPILNGAQTAPASTGGLGAAVYAKLNPAASGGAQLLYSTYLGGGSPYSGSYRDTVTGIAADSSGNAYLTGVIASSAFPTTPGSFSGGAKTAFVTKINPSVAGAASLVYSAVSGAGGAGISVDANGNAYVVGAATPGVPLVNPVQNSANGVMQSVTAGQSWTALTQGITEFPLSSLAIDTSRSPRQLYAGTWLGSVFATSDGGLNWSRVFRVPAGSPGANVWVGALAVDPTTPTNVYAGTSGGIVKSPDRGATWTASNAGLSSTAVQGVLALAFDGRTLYAGAGDGMYQLTAGASAWTFLGPAADVENIAIDSTTLPHTLYTASPSAGAYKSTDGGGTWTPLPDGQGGAISSIGVDLGTSPATLYAMDPGAYPPLLKSGDGGLTWVPLNSSPDFSFEDPAAAMYIDGSTTPSTVYLRDYANGIFKSADGGNTWTSPLGTPLGAFAADATLSPTVLYAGTSNPVANAFIAELNSSGSGLLFSTYLGGLGSNTSATGMNLDGASNVYVVGWTAPPIAESVAPAPRYYFPTVNAFQSNVSAIPSSGNPGYAFFTKFGPQVLPASSSTSVTADLAVATGTMSVTFPNITGSTAGATPTVSVTPLSSTTTANFSLSNNLGAYDISTTALFSGSVMICLQAATVNDPAVFNTIQLLHVVNGTPVDITTTRDFTSRTICGTASSFSPFVLVAPQTPGIVWNNPADIIFGTALSGTQLNATASVPGSFQYTPAIGTILGPGSSQTLTVTFTPSDRLHYTVARAQVKINVLYATGACQSEPGHAILPPINPNGSSVFQLGSSIPTKFRVCDVHGASVGLAGTVVSYQLIAVGSSTGLTLNTKSTTPGSAFRWDATAQQWVFNQSTGQNNPAMAQPNTYVFKIGLKDGTAIQFQYALK